MLLALGLLAAQAPVKITVNTQLVVETVSVTDKNGKPVEGLTAKDFVVTEDGVVQTVSFCEYQKMQEVAPAPAPAPVADQVAPVTRGQIAPERPGDVRYKDRRLLALYFDMSAMPVPDQLRAQAAAVKFIRTQMQPADLMAILSFSDGVHVLRDFTDNRNDLENTVNKLFVGEGRDSTSPTPTTAAPIRAPHSARTTANSTSSTPTANWPRCRPASRCWARSTRRRCSFTSPAACG
jgi:VWFA-related protein